MRTEAPQTDPRESRHLTGVELRVTDDGLLEFGGYASVFDTPYDVAGGAPHGWSEIIAPGAFSKALREKNDVRLLLNHEGLPIARTKSGTMTLAQDDLGLRVEAHLDPENPTVQELRSAMARGVMSSASSRRSAPTWSSSCPAARAPAVSIRPMRSRRRRAT